MIGRIPRRVGFAPFRTGRAVREASLSLRVAIDPAAGSVRVAFSTPKRIGSAVERNRIRRRLRELMRARAERLPHGWYLVQVDVGSVDNDWGQLGTMLDRVLDRALRESTKAVAPTTHGDLSTV